MKSICGLKIDLELIGRNIPRILGYSTQMPQTTRLEHGMRHLLSVLNDKYELVNTSVLSVSLLDFTLRKAARLIKDFHAAKVKPTLEQRERENAFPIDSNHYMLNRSIPGYLSDTQGCELLCVPDNIGSTINRLAEVMESLCNQYEQYIHFQENGYVYFLLTLNRNEPIVKIGYQSTLNNSRSNTVHSHCPYELAHIGSCKVRDGVRSEKRLHKELDYHHFNREWFKWEDGLIEKVNFYLNRGYYDCVSINSQMLDFGQWSMQQKQNEWFGITVKQWIAQAISCNANVVNSRFTSSRVTP